MNIKKYYNHFLEIQERMFLENDFDCILYNFQLYSSSLEWNSSLSFIIDNADSFTSHFQFPFLIHCYFVQCATSSCHRQNSANQAWVQRFTQLVRRHGRFTCYTNEKHEDEALLYKFYGPSTLFNTIFWPLGLLFLSGICLLFVWLYDRCRVWGDDSGVIA